MARSRPLSLSLCHFRAAGVRLVGEMPQEDLHAVVKNCFALVNSSVSEGMSAAILEVSITRVWVGWEYDLFFNPSSY
jgi:hypothetical protein